ncbi:unnamed protein product [Darwinula stevensoni]|uniref:DUF7027 domain-containing protein n=1 Tax=Darwinula stevensoni TaxID=69355 RepID=A0A7R9A5A2_9CRUS|nr:unnamed protein product [Darwinula stevensoni]CAG0893977.1 unnamed protein product [Darwinula stevensoni]
MRIPIARGCCCRCLSNREGSIVIAVLGLVEAVGSILSIFPHFVDLSVVDIKFPMSGNIYVKITITVVSAIFVMMNSLLIHGIRKSNRKLMIPWLCAAFLFLVLMVLAAVALAILTVVVGTRDPSWTAHLAVATVALVVLCPVGAHFFLVVYTHFKELENSERDGEGHERIRFKEAIHSNP